MPPNYGSAPYEESAFKAALRQIISGSAGFGAGLGAVRPGSNFADAFLQSAGRSSLAVQQASQAAQEYAMRQEEIQRRREEDAIRSKLIEAQIENMNRPEPPEKPQPYRPMTREEWIRDYEDQKRIDAKYRPPKEGEKPKSDKPPGPTAAERNTISEAVRLIKQMNPFDEEDLAVLRGIVANPPTPEEGAAAWEQLQRRNIPMGSPGKRPR